MFNLIKVAGVACTSLLYCGALATPSATAATCGNPYAIESGKWTIFSVPCSPDPLTLGGQIDEDDLGTGAVLGRTWRVLRLNEATGRKVDMNQSEELRPGEAYWIYSRQAVTLSFEGNRVENPDTIYQDDCMELGLPGQSCAAVEVNIPTGYGRSYFRTIGNPYRYPVSVSEIQVAVCDDAGECTIQGPLSAAVNYEEPFSVAEGIFLTQPGTSSRYNEFSITDPDLRMEYATGYMYRLRSTPQPPTHTYLLFPEPPPPPEGRVFFTSLAEVPRMAAGRIDLDRMCSEEAAEFGVEHALNDPAEWKAVQVLESSNTLQTFGSYIFQTLNLLPNFDTLIPIYNTNHIQISADLSIWQNVIDGPVTLPNDPVIPLQADGVAPAANNQDFGYHIPTTLELLSSVESDAVENDRLCQEDLGVQSVFDDTQIPWQWTTTVINSPPVLLPLFYTYKAAVATLPATWNGGTPRTNFAIEAEPQRCFEPGRILCTEIKDTELPQG